MSTPSNAPSATPDAVVVVLLTPARVFGQDRPRGFVVALPAPTADILIAQGHARAATETDRAIARV